MQPVSEAHLPKKTAVVCRAWCLLWQASRGRALPCDSAPDYFWSLTSLQDDSIHLHLLGKPHFPCLRLALLGLRPCFLSKWNGEKKSKSNRQRRERERISFHGAWVLGFWASLLFQSIRGINLCLLKKKKGRKERREGGIQEWIKKERKERKENANSSSNITHLCLPPLTPYCCCWVAQSCLILRDPMDCIPPGSSGHGILQARILEWVVISFSRDSSRPRNWTRVSSTGRWILYHWHIWEALTPCTSIWTTTPPSGSSIYTHTNISWRTPEHLPELHSREITLNGICPLQTSAAHTTLRKNPDLVPVWDMGLSYRLAVNLQTGHTSREKGQQHWVHSPWPVTQPRVPCLLCAVGVCHLVGAEAHVHKAISPQLSSRSTFCPCASSPWLKGHWIQKEENHKAECSPR